MSWKSGDSPHISPLLLFLCLALSSAVAQDAPPAHLTLQLPLAQDLEPLVGPAAQVVAPAPTFLAPGGGGPGLVLGQETLDQHGRYVHNAPQALLRLAAQAVVSTAQGAVSFWVRAPRVKDPRAKDFPVLLRLSGGGGGTWSVAVRETPYAPATKALTGTEAQALAEAYSKTKVSELDLGVEDGTGAALELAEGQTPVATLACRVAIQLWPEESDAGLTLEGRHHTRIEHGWHHVVWTWRSLTHDIYIDGVRVGGDRPQNRISRLAPMTRPGGVLEVLTAAASLRDLRVYNRALAEDEAAGLGRFATTQHLPPLPPARIWVDWAGSTGRAVVFLDAAGLAGAAAVQLRLLDEAGKTDDVFAMPSLPNGLGELVLRPFAPDPFPAGTYRVEGVVSDGAGRELARAQSAPWTWEAKPWPFLGFSGGRREAAAVKVIPPFTPVRCEGREVSTVLRTHCVDRTGLFSSIVAAGAELLAGPVRLDVVAAGGPLAFSGGPGLGPLRGTETEADWQAETVAPGGHRLQVKAHLEYDGVARFDVTLVPEETLAAERIELVIPYRAETARLCHSGCSFWFGKLWQEAGGAWRCRRINWAGPGGERERRPGVVFDSEDKVLGLFPPPVRHTYAPYLHIGNFHRGLSWFVDNDRNWVHAPSIPAMEFVGERDHAYARFNLVARPTTLTAPVTWRFYLLANPFKPLPARWRTWCVGTNQRDANAVARESEHVFWWRWSEYAGGFRPYPGPAIRYDGSPPAAESGSHALASQATYEDWRGRFKGDEVRHIPFINFGTPGGFPGFSPECMVYPYSWKLHNNQPHRDYMAYWLDRCVRDIGIRGVYVDEPYSEPYSYNVLAGDAPYIRPDGTRALGFRYLEGREYIRRTKQLFADHGIDYAVWVHNTNYRALPVFTFADIGMDGEHPQIWVPEFERYHSFYNPDYSRGYIAGQAYGFVGTQMFHSTTNPKGENVFQRLYQKCRQYLAVTYAYGVLPMGPSLAAEGDRLQNIHHAFGIFQEGVEELSMNETARWWPEGALTPEVMAVAGLRNRAADRILLYLAPRAAGRYTVQGGWSGLGLEHPHVQAWNAETGASLQVGASIEIETTPLGFACLWLEGRPAPQAPRPRGVLLGLSFDRGVEADFGGGLLPVAGVASEQTTAPGRDGACLRIGAGAPSVAYPVVPSWSAGSVQFDLRAAVAPRPQPLLQLKHHLDLTLALVAKEKGPQLVLVTQELPFQDPLLATHYAGSARLTPEARRLQVGLPPAGQWCRVVLTWQAGRYALYVDGKRRGVLQTPAAPRLRDAAAPACGLVLGGGEQKRGRESNLDSLLLYAWALTGEEVARLQGRSALDALPCPTGPGRLAAWAQKAGDEAYVVGAAFTTHAQRDRVNRVRFTLREGDSARGTLVTWPWQGVTWGTLRGTLESPAGGAALLDDAFAQEAPEEDEPPTLTLQVELLRQEGKEVTVLATQEQTIEVDLLDDNGVESLLPAL